MVKYIIVSFGGLILNTIFVYLLTDLVDITPNISKIITAIFIGWTYTFALMRYYVFKK